MREVWVIPEGLALTVHFKAVLLHFSDAWHIGSAHGCTETQVILSEEPDPPEKRTSHDVTSPFPPLAIR